MYNKKEYARQWYLSRRDKEIKKSQKYRAENLDERKAYDATRKEQRKDVSLRCKYGISLEQWKQMLTAQNESCAICDKKFLDWKNIHTDHNHTTGQVRQLLCYRCNSAIGFFEEDVSMLAKAIDYLNKWNNP